MFFRKSKVESNSKVIEARERVAKAEAAQQEASRLVDIAERLVRHKPLTDEEWLLLSYFTVEQGLATPEQKRLVEADQKLKKAEQELKALTDRRG